jgi:hypothetical protein
MREARGRDDAQEEHFQQHEDSLRSLAVILIKQDIINDRHDVFLAEHVTLNHRLVDIHQDVKTTLARIETLLARMIERRANGRDA